MDIDGQTSRGFSMAGPHCWEAPLLINLPRLLLGVDTEVVKLLGLSYILWLPTDVHSISPCHTISALPFCLSLSLSLSLPFCTTLTTHAICTNYFDLFCDTPLVAFKHFSGTSLPEKSENI